MIEESLVYICADAAGKKHIGCGVTVEGGLIATCRHVWRDVGLTPHVQFPRINSSEALQPLTLVDDCQDEGAPSDCVLLRPALMPNGIPQVPLAIKDSLETGEAQCRAHLLRGSKRQEVSIPGRIDEAKDPDGRRQFSGQMIAGYWFDPGASGSPLFKKGGQQLAAILSLSEVGANTGQGLYEAFVVPASVMLKYIRRVQAKPIAQSEHLSRAQLDEVLREIGAADVPSDEALTRLKSFIQDAKARAAEPLPIVAEGGDVPAVIAAAREKAGALDTAGALQILEDRLAQETKAHEARMVALLREKAAMERLSFRREEAIATMLRLLALAPAAPWDWIMLGDLYRTLGRSAEARGAYERALPAAIQHDPAGRYVAASHNRIGEILQAQGDLAGALDAYQRSLEIAESFNAGNPANPLWQQDLSIGYERVGDMLMAQGRLAEALDAFGRGMAIAAHLAASDPAHAGWQHDLAACHNRIGDALRMKGNFSAAQNAYRHGIEIAERLTTIDPANTAWQHNLSISLNKIGDMRGAQGDPAGALDAYRRGMKIRVRLAAIDPANTQWQRDLSVSHDRIGDALLAQGNLTSALESFRLSIEIRIRLAESDTANTEWQRDLSISHERIGDALMAQGDLAGAQAAHQQSMAIAERLAARDPLNARWLRDLSVSNDRIGEIRLRQGNLAGALQSHQRSVEICTKLAASDPANAEWRRDLSVSHEGMAGVLIAKGDLAGALAAYRRSYEIRSKLVENDPANVQWQRELVASLVRLAAVAPESAEEHLTRALAIVTSLAETGRLAPRDAWMIEDLKKRLRDLGD